MQGAALTDRGAEPNCFLRRNDQVSARAKHEHRTAHARNDARQRELAGQADEVFLTAGDGGQVSPQQRLSPREPGPRIKGWSYGNDGSHPPVIGGGKGRDGAPEAESHETDAGTINRRLAGHDGDDSFQKIVAVRGRRYVQRAFSAPGPVQGQHGQTLFEESIAPEERLFLARRRSIENDRQRHRVRHPLREGQVARKMRSSPGRLNPAHSRS
jgi:hypothetical protein